MTAKKCILILTADAGFGHRSAALAIQSALQEMTGSDCDIHLINPLEDKRTPFFLRDSQADYDLIVKEAPELYKLGYDASDNPLPKRSSGYRSDRTSFRSHARPGGNLPPGCYCDNLSAVPECAGSGFYH